MKASKEVMCVNKFEKNYTKCIINMDSICDYIKKYDVKIPDFVLNCNKSKFISLEQGDINLLKSIIAYKNFTERRDKALDILEELLDQD